MRKYIFKEIILKCREWVAARSAARIALDIVGNLAGNETTNDSKQPVGCPVVAQKPVIRVRARVSRVPVSTAAARVEDLVAQEGGPGPNGCTGDCRVEVVVAREESGVACLLVVASLRSSTDGGQGETGGEKERRKHFESLYYWSENKPQGVGLKSLPKSDTLMGRQTRGLYSLVLRPSTKQGAFYAWAMGWDS